MVYRLQLFSAYFQSQVSLLLESRFAGSNLVLMVYIFGPYNKGIVMRHPSHVRRSKAQNILFVYAFYFVRWAPWTFWLVIKSKVLYLGLSSFLINWLKCLWLLPDTSLVLLSFEIWIRQHRPQPLPIPYYLLLSIFPFRICLKNV